MTGRTLFAKAAAAAFGVVLAATTAAPAFADDPFSRVVLTVTPLYVVSTNGGQPEQNQTAAGDTNETFLDYGANITINKALSIYYSHDNADFTLDTLQIGPARVPIGQLRDRFDTEGLKWNAGSGVSITAGYKNRSRECCPADAQNPGWIGYHGPFVGVNYAFGPLSSIGPIFDFDLQAQYVDHPYNAALAAPWQTPTIINAFTGLPQSNPVYQPYGGSGFIYPASIAVHVPIDHNHTIIPFFQFGRLADYFASDPGPEYYNVTVAGLVKVFAPWLVFHAAIVNLKEETSLNYPFGTIRDGLPNPAGATNDWVRLTTVNIGLDFHFRG
ncbi:MAG TPA: hypothetical protein VMD91_11200 [Candidatus Sulfotelmatobacter sp.]|nr:hypothetical protein [Candidatus Sulfotelmatobacter sp.]